MSLTVIRPLTFSELLEDPIYRSYVLKTPRLPAGCRNGTPWRVWGQRTDEKWAGKLFAEYRDAFDLVKQMLRDPRYEDVALICRPTEFGPPRGFQVPPLMDWCGHCRRPTVFRRSRRHHAARKWPASDPSVLRCWYCAARQPEHRWYR
jgi:hypothetical protein